MAKEVDQTIAFYDRQAEEYERKWKHYLRHTHQEFLKRIETQPDDVILDPSCGTGLLAQKLVENEHFPFKRLTLNDPSEKMLSIARARLGDRPDIGFSRSAAHDLAFEEGTFTKIFCLNAFHHYPHQQKVLNRFFQMLRPGGTLFLLDWNREGVFILINKIIQWWAEEEIYTRSVTETAAMLRQAGFTVDRHDSWKYRYWNFFFIRNLRDTN